MAGSLFIAIKNYYSYKNYAETPYKLCILQILCE